MRTQILFTAGLLLVAVTLNGQSKAAAFTADEAAIKDVIENESKYFWGRDFKNWKKNWLQTDYIRWTVATKDGVRQLVGWDAWKQEVEKLFEQSPKPQPYDHVKKSNYQFRIYGDGALVIFDQEADTKSRELRVLEKEKGKWKIVVVEAIYNFDGMEQLADVGEN